MLRHEALGVIDREDVLERDADRHAAADERVRHAVAVAADLDVAVPAHLAELPVRRVVACRRQRLQLRLLSGKSFGDDLAHGAVHPGVGLLAQPLFRDLIQMTPAVERPVAHEEMMFDVADHPFVFALCPRPRRLTRARREAVLTGQIEEARVEARPIHPVLEHGALLVVDEHFGRAAAEPLEAADQPFVGMFGILAVRAPEMEPPGVPERVHAEVHRRLDPADHRPQVAPIALQLPPWLRFEPHRRAAGPQRPLRTDVIPQNRQLAGVAFGLQLAINHLRIPDAVRQ